jgi:hypothetical protein
MALDDYLEPEVAIAVVVTAAVASPPVRKALRKGAVYGLAGLLTLGDKITAASRNLARSAASMSQQAEPAANAHETAAETAAG